MNFPANLKYTKDHEWAKIEGRTITVGITDHAQNALGDVVFVELPQIGRTLKKGETFGVVESIKAVSDLYSPITGKVTAVNNDLTQDPSSVNKDPYGQAWLIKIETSNETELSELMDSKKYSDFVASIN